MLISDTGGGHRASAMAIKGAIEHLYGNKYEIKWVAALLSLLVPGPMSSSFHIQSPTLQQSLPALRSLWHSGTSLRGVPRSHSMYSHHNCSIVDLWSAHTPWPHNQLPKTYSTLVKYPILWRITYGVTAPKIVHVPQMRVVRAMIGNAVAKVPKFPWSSLTLV